MSKKKKKKKDMYQQREQDQIDTLEDRVAHLYVDSKRNYKYNLGELDYVGILPNGKWDIYEVKTSSVGTHKAHQQLFAAKKYFWKQCNDRFIYIAQDDEIIKI